MFGAASRGDAVAGDNEREGVAHAGLAHGAWGRAELDCQLTVGQRLAVGDGGDSGAKLITALAGERGEREIKVLARACKPICDLRAGPIQYGVRSAERGRTAANRD